MFVIVMALCNDEEIVNIEHAYGPYSSLYTARDALRNIASIYRRFPDDMKVYVWSNMDSLHVEINHYDKVERAMDVRTLEYCIEEISDILTDTTPDKITSVMESLDGYQY